MSKVKLAGNFLFKWGAVLVLAVLAVAGMYTLLGGVSAFIVFPVSVAFVSLLVREIV